MQTSVRIESQCALLAVCQRTPMSFDAERRALLAQAEIDKEAALNAFEAQAQQQVRRREL